MSRITKATLSTFVLAGALVYRHMRDLKQTGFQDRLSAQADAKKALLARFKPKPAAQDPNFEATLARRAAEKEEQRRQLAAADCGRQRCRRR